VAARLLHAPPPLAVRGFTNCCENKPGNKAVKLASSPLPFLAGGEDHCHLQQEKNTQTAVDFKFSSLFLDLLLSLLLLHICFFLSADPFLFFMFQVVGGRTKGLLANGFLSRLCSC